MAKFKMLTMLSALAVLTACSQASDVAETTSAQVKSTAAEAASMAKEGVQNAVNGVDLSGVPTGTYALEKTHAYITLSYLHQGFSRPVIRWTDWDATLNWNAEDPVASSVSATVPIASVDTGVDNFDEHLVSGNWFDASAFPTATFQSTGLEKTSSNTAIMTGDLTIKGITKPLTLDVTFNKGAKDFRGNTRIGFSAKGQLLRSDWGLGNYAPSTSDEVEIVIEPEFLLTEG